MAGKKSKNEDEATLLERKNNLPRNIRLRATFFFNLRQTTRIDVSNNKLSYMFPYI